MSNLTLKKAWDWTQSHWKDILKTACRLALVAIGVCAAIILYEYTSDKWDDHFGTRGSRMISKKHKIQVFYFAVLEPFIIDGTCPLYYMTKYHEDDCDEYELVPEVVAYRVDSWQGLMDKRTGRILTPPVLPRSDHGLPHARQGPIRILGRRECHPGPERKYRTVVVTMTLA